MPEHMKPASKPEITIKELLGALFVLTLQLALASCSLPAATQPVIAATSAPSATRSVLPSAEPVEPPPPAMTPTAASCKDAWTYQELPEISAQISQSIQALEPGASGFARVYGNGCTYQDGHADFSAVETDFWVRIPVKNFNDENELGLMIVNVMKAMAAFPLGVVPGTRNGLVQIDFVTPTAEVKISGVSIDVYNGLPAGLSNVEIYQKFRSYP